MTGVSKYNKIAKEANSFLCVGLDSELEKIPTRFKKTKHPQFEFNKWIINETAQHVSAYKPNIAFYEARGSKGLDELKMTCDYLIKHYPSIFRICDAKRGDIGNSNAMYARAIFDDLNFDAITLHPYLGKEALKPFLKRKDKVCIILCKTSNPKSGELQDLVIEDIPLWQVILERVTTDWNGKNNCMVVVGATYPNELRVARKIARDITFLIPGIGAQGGNLEKTIQAAKNSKNMGMIINSSRGIIFSKYPGKSAQKLKEDINKFREIETTERL